jgi:hypothetical protein
MWVWLHRIAKMVLLMSTVSGFLVRTTVSKRTGIPGIGKPKHFKPILARLSSSRAGAGAVSDPISFGDYGRSERWNINFSAKSSDKFVGDVLILPFQKPVGAVSKDKSAMIAALKSSIPDSLATDMKTVVVQLIEEEAFKGEGQFLTRLNGSTGPKYLALLGVGSDTVKPGADDKETESVAKIGSSIAAIVREYKVGKIGAFIPQGASMSAIRHLMLSLQDATYKDLRFKKPTSENDEKFPCDSVVDISLLGCDDVVAAALETARRETEMIADGVHFAKDLVGAPSNVKTPLVIANEAKKIASKFGLECKIFGEEECTAMGMGGYLGVQQGIITFFIVQYRF